MTSRACVLLFALSLASPALGQTAEEQAKSLLEDGKTYFSQAKYKQALDNFNTIVTSFANTASVDDALLEIGRYQADVEGDTEKARQSFDSVAKRFPQSDSAPGAYYYLGFLTLAKATTQAEIDDALAQFTRVQRLYAKSDWVPRALYATGLAQRKAGKLADAVEVQRRVSLEYPLSDAAVTAQFQIGHCLALLAEPRPAMEAFQQVRNRFPDSDWAARALERITGLYRLSDGARPSFSVDSSWSVGSGDLLKEVRAILMTPSRTFWIATDKVKSAIPFDPAGKAGPSVGAEDLKSLGITPRGDVIVVSRLAARFGAKDVKSFAVPGNKPGEMETLDKLTSAIMLAGGDALVADDKKKRVYRYSAAWEYKGTYPDAKERQVTRMAIDTEGGVALLDTDEKSVRVFDETGKPLRAVLPKGAGYELKKPIDIAIDPARNLYLVDEELGVLIFAPDGKLLTTISGEELRRPKALTLDPGGAVYVYDEKALRVVRFK